MIVNRRFKLVSRPVVEPRKSDFCLDEEPVPALSANEVLVRNLFASIDPGIRHWLNEEDTYMPAIPLGDAVRAVTLGQVAASTSPRFKEGDWVKGINKIEDYTVASAENVHKVDISKVPSPTAYLSVLGGIGLTAWFAIEEELQPRPGQTLLISGAAGAVGSLAGQLAKMRGAKVVGIAGGPKKCARLVERYGYDAAIDYRGKTAAELAADIAAACPEGVDLVFENVGGPSLDAALMNINWKGTVLICGLIADYNVEPHGTRQLLPLLMKAVTMKGFLTANYSDKASAANENLFQLLSDGKLAYNEHVEVGIENSFEAFMRLFHSTNDGKMILRIAP